LPLSIARGKSIQEHIADALLEGKVGVAYITRIFTPQRSEPGLDGIACGDTAEAHRVSFTKSFPVRAVLEWFIAGGAESRRPHADHQAFGPESLQRRPLDSLPARNRLVGSLRDDHLETVFRRSLWLRCLRRLPFLRSNRSDTKQDYGKRECRQV